MSTTEQALTGQPDAANLPEELWREVWALLMDLERQDEIPRRYEIREILKRRLFFRGEQYWWWNEDQGLWFPPNQAPVGGVDLNDMQVPAFQHVTNIVQAYLLSLSAVLSQNNTRAEFWPQKASDPKDVQTAKNASKAVELIHRNNDFQNRVDEATYYMGTDGFLGAYTRYVSDAEKFGVDERDEIVAQEIPVGSPTVECPACGYGAEGSTDEGPTCPQCGEALSDVPAPTAQVPMPTGNTIRIPRGQEVITIVPSLQLKRTMWADNQEDFLYMDWITDLHKAAVMSAYPEKATLLDSTGGGEGDGNTANTYERIARRLLYLGTGRHTGMVLKDLGTFRRAWIRPKAFYSIPGHADNETIPCKRCQLLSLFDKGCHVVFYNDVYCESRNESMDEKWETMHAMPGEGQLRETLISAIMPVQEQLNDAINLLFEIMLYGVPEGFGASDLLDYEARSQQSAQPGNLTPVHLEPNQTVGSRLLFTSASEPSAAMMKYIDMLLQMIPQFLTGAFPALYGGDTGGNDTASGIAIQRNQSLGRIGRAWRRLQVFLANVDAKSVRVMAKNRTEDLEVPRKAESGEYASDTISLEDLQGNIVAYPEVDSQYPTLQADIRALLMGLWNRANPIFLGVAQVPSNLEYIFRMMGLPDLQVPGEQQRVKTFKDIEQLISEQPIVSPGQPPSPENPQGSQPQMLPSIQPDPDVDDLRIASETAKTYLISDAGIELKASNPAGYENVKAYLRVALQMGKMEMLRQAIAVQGLAGQGPAADLGGAEDMTPPPETGGGPAMSPPQEAPGSQP